MAGKPFLSERVLKIMNKIAVCSNESEVDASIEVKQEPWCLQTTSNEILGWTDDDFHPAESPRLCGEAASSASSGSSALLANEDFEEKDNLEMRKDSLEFEKVNIYEVYGSDVMETSCTDQSIQLLKSKKNNEMVRRQYKRERETADVVRAKLDKKEYRLLKRDGLSSKVWDRFHLVVNEDNCSVGYASCADCSALLTFTSGTTHLIKHVCKGWRDKSCKTLILSPDVKHFIAQKCVDMCVKDLQPYNIVMGNGFKQLGQELIKIGAQYGNINIADIMPHPVTICRHIKDHANKIHNKLMPRVITAIENNACACTVDMWTDCYNQLHYLTLTSHILDTNFKLVNNVLFTSKFLCSATSENIHAEIEAKLAELNILPEQMQKIVFVTDQEVKIKSALQKYEHYPCAAHCLNIVLTQTFHEDKFLTSNAPKIMKTLAIAKNVVRYIQNSGNSLANILKQETVTKWNSMYTMLNSLHQHHEQIVEILNENHMQDKLQGYDDYLAGKLVAFLKHFKEASDDLEKQNEPTIQTVLLWFHKLKAICLSFDNDCEELKKIKCRSLQLLVEKMEINTTHKVATFLWPTFRHLAMLTDVEREQVHQHVRHLCGSVAVNSDNSECTPSPPKKRDRFKEWHATAPSTRNEVDAYLKMDIGDDEDLLKWWHLQEHKLPSLFRIAQHVLCVPATIASSERYFIKFGFLLTSRSNQLDPDRIKDLLVVHNNNNYINSNRSWAENEMAD